MTDFPNDRLSDFPFSYIRGWRKILYPLAKKIEVKADARRKAGTAVFKLQPLEGKGWLLTNNFILQAMVVALVAFGFYFNSYSNKYALDDDIIMKENMYVQKGFSGIYEIMTNDAYKSYYQSMGVDQQLSGGRYRPLSIVSFAIEQQLFGHCYGERAEEVRDSVLFLQKKGITDANYFRLTNEKNELLKQIEQTNLEIAPVRHVFQVLWFTLSMIVLLWFLRECIFRKNTDIAFLAALLFTMHPIHTEVVANVKSRDEIFSLLFICLTFIFYFRYDVSKKMKDGIWGSVFFLLALFSKEYAAVVPLLLIVGAWIFRKKSITEVLLPFVQFVVAALPIAMLFLTWQDSSTGAVVVFAILACLLPVIIRVLVFRKEKTFNWMEFALCASVVYVLFRLSSVGGGSHYEDPRSIDPLNAPYMFANPAERLGSIINRLDDYLWLLFKPYPLSSDYSYANFAYTDFTSGEVWLSFFVNVALAIIGIIYALRRHVIGFAILWYFAFFMLVNNVLFEVGATMGERLIYHSSVGFCIAIAFLLIKGLELLGAAKTEEGHAGNGTLTMKAAGDQPSFPVQSPILIVIVLAIGIPFCLITTQRNLKWHDDYTLFSTDVITHPNSALTNGNAGARNMDKGLTFLGHDTTINGKLVQGYGRDTVKVHRYADTAIFYLERATRIHKKYVNGWLNLGLCYYYKENYDKAAYAWSNAYRYFPSNPILLNYEQMLIGKANERASKQDYAAASKFFLYAATAVPSDAKAWSDCAGASFMARDFTTSRYAFQQALIANSNLQKQLDNGLHAAANNEIAMRKFRNDSSNYDSILPLARAYTGTELFYPESRRLLNKAMTIRPGDPRAPHLLDSLGGLEEIKRKKEAASKK